MFIIHEPDSDKDEISFDLKSIQTEEEEKQASVDLHH